MGSRFVGGDSGAVNLHLPPGFHKVIFIPLDASGRVSGPAQDFATGWLINGNAAVGRPVGLAVGRDGALYLSDDKAGIIYRITYNPPASHIARSSP